jgi:hypothetical protein
VAAEEESDAELAKKAQNPIADMIIFPFQDNVNKIDGPGSRSRAKIQLPRKP